MTKRLTAARPQKETKMATKKQAEKRVVIWTKSRPWVVAMGTLASRRGDVVALRDARLAVYYDQASRGVLGLATRGPGDASRVSGVCEEVEIGGVEGVATATPAAIAAWEREPWR